MFMSALLEYYTSGIEEERLVRNLCNRLEWETTLHVLAPYFPPACRLLEVGAGYGRYSLHYAGQGHHVTAVELVAAQVAALQQKVAQLHLRNVRVYQGDACDLNMVADGVMDVVLCLGPLYHLRTQQDRLRCLSESLRVLRPDGILAVAYLSRFSAAALRVKRDVQSLATGYLDELLDHGLIQNPAFDPFTRSAYFTTPEEMETLVTTQAATLLEHVATDGVAKLMEETVNGMTEAEYQHWFAYHLRTCRERSLLGYSTHGLIVCQKRK